MRKNAKKRFSTCKSGDAECEIRRGILIGKFIFWCLRYYDYRIWFWEHRIKHQNTSLKSTSISVHCHNVTWKSGKESLLLINRAAVLKAIYCFRHWYLLSKQNMNDEALRNLDEICLKVKCFKMTTCSIEKQPNRCLTSV